MSADVHGYDLSVGYTYGFGREMAPDWLDLAARLAGQRPPRTAGAPFRYLELGSGQGMGLCLLAAANPAGSFLGIDFDAAQVEHGRALAAAAQIDNVRFVAGDFIDLAADWPDDFGRFDYAVLHGVYTWVAPAVRAAVVACLAAAMRPGGLVYNGYNTQPGWLGTVPFQHITRALRETTGRPAEEAIGASIALFDRLRTGGAATFQILPGLGGRLDKVKTQRPAYLAHEYLSQHWQPLWHSAVARDLAAIDLHHIGTATLAETMLPDPLPPALRQAIAEQPDAALRQDVQDFVINQFFRRDLFVSGAPDPGERQEAALAATPIHLLVAPAAGQPLKFDTAFAEIMLEPPAFAAIVKALRDGPLTMAQIAALPEIQRQGAANARQITLLLLHAGTLGVGAAAPDGAEKARALNAAIARGAAEGLPYDHLAAPALGSAIATDGDDLRRLHAWLNGTRDAAFERDTLPRWRALGAIA